MANNQWYGPLGTATTYSEIQKVKLSVAKNCENCRAFNVQGDHSLCAKLPVDFKAKVPLWPGQGRAGQAKTELLF